MIFDILKGWLHFNRPMKKKLTYKEILEFTKNCRVKPGQQYYYKNVEYTVVDVSLVAGIDKEQWMVTYYPAHNILLRFSRELEDFKNKFNLIDVTSF